jgi:hypothetical protein
LHDSGKTSGHHAGRQQSEQQWALLHGSSSQEASKHLAFVSCASPLQAH